MCGGSPEPPDVTPPPVMADPEIQEAARKQRELEKRRRGRASTIRTGPGGITSPEGTQKTLLGQ